MTHSEWRKNKTMANQNMGYDLSVTISSVLLPHCAQSVMNI